MESMTRVHFKLEFDMDTFLEETGCPPKEILERNVMRMLREWCDFPLNVKIETGEL